jgi:hypothetical protein
MKRIAIGQLITVVSLSCLPPAGHAGAPPSNAFVETAAVDSHAGHVKVMLTFDNRGNRAVYVPNDLAEDDELSNAFFEIMTTAGEKIPCIGIMAKRAPPAADDFHEVAPHARHVNTLDITRSYDFKPGLHRYVLSYEARYLTDLQNVDRMSSAGKVRVEFTHGR